MEKKNKVLTAISLQGGGALGAYECGVLKALYDDRGKGFNPRVVAGISIGAINAALLAGAKKDPVKTMETVWRERFTVSGPAAPFIPFPFVDVAGQSLSYFGNPGMYLLRPEFFLVPFAAPFCASSIYITAPLRQTLEEFVDVDKLNRPDKTRIIVTAVHVETGRQVRFDNSKMRLTFDHILASSSFPISFPMTVIGDDPYWDGGIFINNPLGAAVTALEEAGADGTSAERELIIINVHRLKGKVPDNLQEASERFYNLLFSDKIALDRALFQKFDSFVDLVQAIDKTLPADSPIRQQKGYKELIRHRKIDRAVVIGEEGAGAIGSVSDFSAATVAQRIEDGYNDAKETLSRGMARSRSRRA